jgi:uncharacterized membrane protein YbhN (UPF0104 family)
VKTRNSTRLITQPEITSVSSKPSEWDQFKELIDLHKFYFDQILKGAAFSFAIVGGISSYILTNNIRDPRTLVIALMVPALLSLGTCFVGAVGSIKVRELGNQVRASQKKLGLTWRAHAEILFWMCAPLAALFFLIAVGLLMLAFQPSWLPAIPKSTPR